MSDTKLDTNVLLKITNDCFTRMNNNINDKAVGQRGGGSHIVLDSIIPYLVSINTMKVSGSTKVPEAILYTVVGKAQGRFDLPLSLDSILDRDDIQLINRVLHNRPRNY